LEPEVSSENVNPEDLVAECERLPEPVRQYLATLHGLNQGIVEAAISGLPLGTLAGLIAMGAVRDDDPDFAPKLTEYGRALLAYLAEHESVSIAVPSLDSLETRYKRVRLLAEHTRVPIPKLTLGAVIEPRSPMEAPVAVRAVEALADDVLETVLHQDQGVIGIQGAGELVIEPTPGGVEIRNVTSEPREWDVVTAEGKAVGQEATEVAIGARASLQDLAKSLFAVRRHAK
jgi:hypothetical protein